jgi:hypothetical protein
MGIWPAFQIHVWVTGSLMPNIESAQLKLKGEKTRKGRMASYCIIIWIDLVNIIPDKGEPLNRQSTTMRVKVLPITD